MKKEKQTLAKLNNDVFIFIDNDSYIKFKSVYQFPDCETCLGHIMLWDDKAPFYVIFERNQLKELNIKGYKDCLFIPNTFVRKFDKNAKMYLKCDDYLSDFIFLKYYPITSIENIREIARKRMNGKVIYAGFPKDYDSIQKVGEAIELVKFEGHEE
jgi:hypothetical protein